MILLILICKDVKFYTRIDAHTFFDWIQGVSAVEKVKVIGDEIYIWVKNTNLSYLDLNKIVSLFVRYNIQTVPSKVFMNNDNKEWLSYWVTKFSEKK